ILMLKDAFSLITIYYTWPQIILMFGAGFAAIAAIVLMFSRMRRRKRLNRAASILTFVGLLLSCFMCSAVGVRSEFFPRRFENLVDAYNDYGFATCFCFTFGQQGISRPETYSTEAMADILKDIDADNDDDTVYTEFHDSDNLAQPNIIFVQLESFFDVNTIIGGEYSADPTPTFNRLCRNFPSGLLFVPTIGGGTANTEFEVLTGMNIDFFGAGEYPYNTILQQEAVESVCTNLRPSGYTSTAMHNNSGTFYSRNAVYPNLGFDRFVPLEYMRDVKYTSLGWARDAGLTDEILKALRSTEGRDLVMCITVESHGKYAETYEPKDGDIEVLSLPEGVAVQPFQNFINVIPATDEFLKKLVHAMARFDEPTVVVAYGDHLPALELSADMLTTGSVYATRYVIWNNFGKTFDAPDLQAYRLSAHVLEQLGFVGGLICKYHQSADPADASEAYLDKLEKLQYDILYGDRSAFEGESPYQPTAMTMGSVPIAISNANAEYGRLLVTGENFTEFSRIVANGQPLQTAYVDPTRIVAPLDGDAPENFTVAQIAKDDTVLSETPTFQIDN
ncbi:MAG: LTA synthase family protein, partial [bacterium]